MFIIPTETDLDLATMPPPAFPPDAWEEGWIPLTAWEMEQEEEYEEVMWFAEDSTLPATSVDPSIR